MRSGGTLWTLSPTERTNGLALAFLILAGASGPEFPSPNTYHVVMLVLTPCVPLDHHGPHWKS